jgi:hypothetical protein
MASGVTVAAIYARKSTDDSNRSEEARSITRQVERATAYAQAKGWTVDPRYIFTDEAASGAEWKLQLLHVKTAADLDGAFQAATQGRVGAVVTVANPFFAIHAARIAELALKHRLPLASCQGARPHGPARGVRTGG